MGRRSPRLVEHLRAARASAPPCHDQSWTDKPRVGTGTPPPLRVDAASAVVRLARFIDRGEVAPLSLLLLCLDHIQDLKLTSSGGDALLWMIAPVLRAAHCRLEEAADERQALEVEVSALRRRAEQLSMDVEGEREWLRRAEETQKLRLKDRREAARTIETDAVRLRQDLTRVEAESAELRQQADEGLAVERDSWGRECQLLEDETANLVEKVQHLDSKLDLDEPFRQAQEQLAAANEKLNKFKSACDKQEELARRIDDRESKIQDLRNELEKIEQLELEKAMRRKGKRKK